MAGNENSRIWELDFFRGIALLCMVYFHIIFDLKEFYNAPVSYSTGVNYLTGKIAVVLFTLIAGISCNLSRSNFKRGLKILGTGLLITLASYLYNPGFVIIFGVLHFLGTCVLLIYPVVKRLKPMHLLLLGTAVITLGTFIDRIQVSHNYFFILGIISSSFASSDYYPLIPWSGIFLYGVALGKLFYIQKKSVFGFVLKENVVSTAGRHTLPVYILHQPVIMVVLHLIYSIF